jgi:O-antigen/teichoic acid export membrane protein
VTTETTDDVPEAINAKASRGLRWSLLGNMAMKVASFGMAIVLARLLTPADFGDYAVALAATQFVMHVNDVGLIAGTVQWRGALEKMAPTASTLAFAFSVVIYLIFFFLAPPFANLAGTPEAVGLVRLLTVVILIDGVTAVRAAKLMRTFEQDKLTKANFLGFCAQAIVAITMAANGGGPYSFVVGMLAGSLVTGILVFIWAALPVRVGFDREVAKKLLRFGIPLAASLGVEAVLMNADYVIVGNVTGAVLLGFYLLAFNVSSWVPGVISTAIRQVSVAGFSRLSEHTPEALSAGVTRSVPLLVTGLVPIAVLLAVLAPQLVDVLFGAQWEPAAAVLRWLVVLTVVRMLTSFALDILTGAGATRATFWLNLGWALALIPALLVGAHRGGIVGAAVAHAIVGSLVALPLAVLMLHRAGVRLAPIGPVLVRPLLAGALTAAVTVFVVHISGREPLVQLIVGGCVGLGVYVVTAVPLKQLRQWAATIRPGRTPAPAVTD